MVPRNVRLVSTLIIGREPELDTLEHAMRNTQQGTGSCILVAGEAGLGKSRLVAELRRRALRKQFVWLQGYCFEQDVGFPYAPWTDALRTYFARYSASEINAQLGLLAPEFVKLLPELSLLLPQIQPSPPLEPEAEKRRRFETVTRFIANLGTAHPVLIVLEDLHWSDELSLELLHVFARRIAHLPILLIGTYRTEERSAHLSQHVSDLSRAHLLEEIRLTPLARDHVEQMARAMLDSEVVVGDSLLDALEHLTEGNPFYIEEMLKSLTETSSIAERFGRWELESGRDLTIPRNIQDAIQWRLEGLSENALRIVTFAAVAGQRFDVELLQAVAQQADQPLLQAMKELMNAQLIVEQSPEQFAFRHALTREAVYASLLKRERKAMHHMIGEIMERLAGARTDAAAAQLAYHFYEGGVWQKALEYSQRASEQAQALYAPREALTHLTHALDAAQNLGLPAPRASLRGRAQVYEVLGEFDYARADHEAALESARREQNRIDEWQALIDLGFLWQSRDLERAGEYYRQALELARQLEDTSLLAPNLNRIGNWYVNRGRTREALPFHREALELFRQLHDRRGMAQTMDLLGVVSYQLGEVIQGAAYREQAIPIWRDFDDRQELVNTLTSLTARARLDDTEVLGEINLSQLTKSSDEALVIAHSIKWYQGEVLALMEGACSLERAGEYGRALERLTLASSMAEESRNRESFARLHLNLGEIFIGLLALTEARQHVETGLTMVQELGSWILTLIATARLASLSILQNDFTRAKYLLDALLPADFPQGQLPIPLRRCWSVRAELELAQGQPRRALEIVDGLLATTPNLALFGPHAVPRLSRLRAQALAAVGRMEEAEAELQGTLPIARTHGKRPMLWRLHTDLGKVYRAMGRRDDAEREFSAARTIIQDLANHVPDGNLRDHFLTHALAAIPAAPALTPRQAAKQEFGGLTAREREIAALVAQGKSNREIADELVISQNTAERHVANILSKLGFNSRTQIGVWATQKGLYQ